MPYPGEPSHEILHIFSIIFESVLEQHKPLYHSTEYREHLRMLEWRLKNVKVDANEYQSFVATPRARSITELYRIAALIYLERSSGNISNESDKISAWVDRAFTLLDELQACNWPLLLFIFGLEARSDAQRLKVLNLVSKTEKETRARNLETAKALVRMSWVQDDLGTKYIDYVAKLDMLLSSSEVLPTMV